MKASRNWLQDYFADPLPDSDALVEALTFHSSEVEGVEAEGDDAVLEVKVLPDRAGYALCHRGIAAELAAALDQPLANDPFAAAPFDAAAYPSESIAITIDDPARCARYVAVRMDGVTVGPSPEWLRTRLEAVGQRSINNVVDATNYVMLALGQPLHAFDAAALAQPDGTVTIRVRPSEPDEQIEALGGTVYPLPEGTTIITDQGTSRPLAIAGVKGGAYAGVTSTTTSILLEAASFDPKATRRTAQTLKLFTDASLRFQNGPSPELVGYAMREVVALIEQIAGGMVRAASDLYPASVAKQAPLTVSLARIEAILGMPVSAADARDALSRLGLAPQVADGSVTITPPFWRSDLTRAEDVAEEVGRILGYDRLPAVQLPPLGDAPDQRRFRGIERIRDTMLKLGFGFDEVSTQSFAATGAIELANPLQADRPYLRSDLASTMRDALVRAKEQAPRVLGPITIASLFEIGTIFTEGGERLHLCMGIGRVSGPDAQAKASLMVLLEALRDDPELSKLGLVRYKLSEPAIAEFDLDDLEGTTLEKLGEAYEPALQPLAPYRPFSIYPFALRDVAVWVPADIAEEVLAARIREAAGEHLVRMDRFDRFEKEGCVSYAFRLVFQSFERTLSDTDLDPAMERVYEALRAEPGWEPR